jgi:hypothetical protein
MRFKGKLAWEVRKERTSRESSFLGDSIEFEIKAVRHGFVRPHDYVYDYDFDYDYVHEHDGKRYATTE